MAATWLPSPTPLQELGWGGQWEAFSTSIKGTRRGLLCSGPMWMSWWPWASPLQALLAPAVEQVGRGEGFLLPHTAVAP